MTVISLGMNFWSDILNRSCKGSKNVLYILYYHTLQFILFNTVHDRSKIFKIIAVVCIFVWSEFFSVLTCLL